MLRRLLVFVLLAGGGVLLLVLLSEEQQKSTTRVNRLEEEPDTNRAVVERSEGDAVKVRFEDTEFDLLEPYEVSDGVFEERAAYRLHMASGEPGDDGTFLVKQPRLEFLDIATGVPTGDYLESDDAEFFLEESVAGDVRIDPTSLRPEHFTLTGNVHGRVPSRSGPSADIEADVIDVDGPRVTALGEVKWVRPDASVHGWNMTWDESTGRIHFERDTHLVMIDADAGRNWELFAPGGLTGVLPPGSDDPQRDSTWELRGQVTGTGPDGARIGADTAWFDGPTSRVTLDGSSVMERDDGTEKLRVEAQHLVMEQDEHGRLALADANGDVHLLSAPVAILPAWMIGESLRLEGALVSTPDPSTWSREGVTTSGEGLTWDRDTGVVAFEKDAVVEVDEGSLKGLRMTTPGGMTWEVPPGASDAAADATGRLHGRVVGRMPDGSEFSADVLLFEGPLRRYTLDGDVEILRREAGADQRLNAQHVVARADEGGRLVALTATGDVVLLSSVVHVLPTRIETQRLDLEGRVASSPELVTWSRGDLLVVGRGMRYDETAGRLDIDRDARIRVFAPSLPGAGGAAPGDAGDSGGGDGAPALPVARDLTAAPEEDVTDELTATEGLTWTFPAGAIRPLAEGSGEFRGLVRGRTSDGLELATEKLLLDGPRRHAVLLGDSVVDLAGDTPTHLASDHIDVRLVGEHHVIRTDRPAEFARGPLVGSSDSLQLDERTGEVVLGARPSLRVHDERGRLELALDATGGLTGTLPPDAEQPLAASRWHVIGDVDARLADGTRISADEARIEQGGRDITLSGTSRYGRDDAAGGRHISARNGMSVQRDEAGQVLWFSAQGQVEGNTWTTGAEAERGRVAGDAVVMDRATGITTVTGDGVIERDHGGSPQRIRAERRIVVHTGPDDALRRVEAEGRVRCTVGEYESRSDTLSWDLEQDLAILDGNCMLLAMGMWMPARQVVLHPEAETFEIKGPELHLDDQP